MSAKPLLLNIALCSSGKVYSGGEKTLVELIRQFNRLGYVQEVFVSHREEGSELFDSADLKLFYALKGTSYAETKLMAIIKYVKTFIAALRFVKHYDENIVIISHSEMWPDVTFAFLLKLFNLNSKWIAFIHALVPERVYDPSPVILRIYNLLNQYWFLLLQLPATFVVTVNPGYIKYLSKFNKHIIVIKLGKETPINPNNSYENRAIDICFIGRFFGYKGVREIPEILNNLAEIKKSIGSDKVLNIIIAGRENEESADLKKKLQKLPDISCKFTGFIEYKEKHEILSRSKVLLYPSFRESFGIVYLDAISEGVPVVEYDMPDFQLHTHGVIKVPFKNNKLFAENLYSVIFNRNVFDRLSADGIQYSHDFDWQRTAEKLSSNF